MLNQLACVDRNNYDQRMINRVWIIWVAVELAALLLLAALWPANVSAGPKWECTSAGGWSMAIDGSRTSIPMSDVATILELSAPDKIRVLNAGSDIERKIYQSMSWEERGGKYYGHGILRDGALVVSVSEVLTDTGSTSTATILGYEEPVWAGRSDCVRLDQQSNLQATVQKSKKKQDNSFLDAISKRDAITGKRSLNIQSEIETYNKGRAALRNIVDGYKQKGYKLFKPGDADFDRVKRITDRIIAASHYAKRPGIYFEVVDSPEINAFATGGGFFAVHTGLMRRLNDDELSFVIAHELVHNVAGHIEEDLPLMLLNLRSGASAVVAFTNVQEQEADKVALVYTALAGYDPCASVSVSGKLRFQLYESTHPSTLRRVATNKYNCSKVKKYRVPGKVNPDVQKVLQCNELFCNKGGSNSTVGGLLELLTDTAEKQLRLELEREIQKLQYGEN